MKTILEINTTNYASTGNIALNIAKEARNSGFKVYTACKNAKESLKYQYEDQIYIGNRYDRLISQELAYITGLRGYFNILGTRSFLKKVDEIKPDLIHLHVLHDTFINLNMLFKYINKHNIPVVWTFHDCWNLTGQCPAFEMIGCNKWKTGCHNCPQIHVEPKSLFLDTTRHIWNKQRKLFTSPKNMTIVSPSLWLKEQIDNSFFNKCKTVVINNGINLDIFKPQDSDFRTKYNLENKKLILGVANIWEARKGLDTFMWLNDKLPEDYAIILVGTNDEIDKVLPKNIISIHRTYNQQELIDIYSAVDVFVNPTREDNFPTVNIEAIACGTPVITFNTGGSPEIIDETCGITVEKNNNEELLKSIIYVCDKKPFSSKSCNNRAKLYDKNVKFKEYVDLYNKILKTSDV